MQIRGFVKLRKGRVRYIIITSSITTCCVLLYVFCGATWFWDVEEKLSLYRYAKAKAGTTFSLKKGDLQARTTARTCLFC